MKLVRTYPPAEPELMRSRNRVEDDTPRAFIQRYDNRSLLQFKDDLIILEWDIALSREDLFTFAEVARGSDQVLAAPYRLYRESDERLPPEGVWSPRVVTNPTSLDARWVRPGDLTCDFFGFGCTYVPHKLIEAFCTDKDYETADPRMTDANFSVWHYRRVGTPVPILWAIRPVHLHYATPEL